MPAFGNQLSDPGGIGVQQRGMDAYQAAQQQRTHDWYGGKQPIGAPPPVNNILPDPKWQGLFQAMAEQGVTKAGTAAASGMGQPGFFDTQDPRAQQKQALMNQLRAQDVNTRGKSAGLSYGL